LPLSAITSCDRLIYELSYEFDVLDGESDGLFFRVSENLVSEYWCSSVVHVEDDVSGISYTFNRSSDERFTSGRENLVAEKGVSKNKKSGNCKEKRT